MLRKKLAAATLAAALALTGLVGVTATEADQGTAETTEEAGFRLRSGGSPTRTSGGTWR